MNLAIETDVSLDEVRALADVVYNNQDVGAAVASGSFRTRGMIVAPCTVKTLSAIANSFTYNLVVRAADVQLKEGPQARADGARDAAAQGPPRPDGACRRLRRRDPAADAGLLSPADVDHGPDPPEHRQGARPGRHRARPVQALERPRPNRRGPTPSDRPQRCATSRIRSGASRCAVYRLPGRRGGAAWRCRTTPAPTPTCCSACCWHASLGRALDRRTLRRARWPPPRAGRRT